MCKAITSKGSIWCPTLVTTVKGAANFRTEDAYRVVEARASATQVKIDASNLTPEKTGPSSNRRRGN